MPTKCPLLSIAGGLALLTLAGCSHQAPVAVNTDRNSADQSDIQRIQNNTALTDDVKQAQIATVQHRPRMMAQHVH